MKNNCWNCEKKSALSIGKNAGFCCRDCKWRYYQRLRWVHFGDR